MRLTIDDIAKTIEVSEDILLSDLFSRLDSLFPGKEWHQYTLKTTVVRYETQPYIPQPFPYIPQYPSIEPYYDPWRITVQPCVPLPYSTCEVTCISN